VSSVAHPGLLLINLFFLWLSVQPVVSRRRNVVILVYWECAKYVKYDVTHFCQSLFIGLKYFFIAAIVGDDDNMQVRIIATVIVVVVMFLVVIIIVAVFFFRRYVSQNFVFQGRS
jgi:hypothetical protein